MEDSNRPIEGVDVFYLFFKTYWNNVIKELKLFSYLTRILKTIHLFIY